MNRTTKLRAIAVAAAVATLAIGASALPRPPQLSPESSGDETLVEQVRALASEDGPRHRMSVALLDGGEPDDGPLRWDG